MSETTGRINHLFFFNPLISFCLVCCGTSVTLTVKWDFLITIGPGLQGTTVFNMQASHCPTPGLSDGAAIMSSLSDVEQHETDPYSSYAAKLAGRVPMENLTETRWALYNLRYSVKLASEAR